MMVRNDYDLLCQWADRQPDHLLLADDAWSCTYQEMRQSVTFFADRLKQRRPLAWENGDVLVLADSLPGQLTAFLALQAMGIRPILLHHGMRPEEQRAILRENHLQGLLCVRGEGKNPDLQLEETGISPCCHSEPDILGVLSSGSTGTPKVMYRTYDSWAGFFPVQNPIFRVASGTRLFLHGSLSFTGNLNTLLSVLYEGGTVITSEYLRCRHWADLMRRFQADVLYLIPTKLQLMTAAVHAPLSSVQSIFTGSQLLSARNIRELRQLFPSAELILYYGASELNYITYAVCEDPERDPRNLGRPFPGISVNVREGLIYVDTAYHVSGVTIPFTVRDAGWLNERGELMFEGRRDAWVNKGGVKLSTIRLENELRAIRGVREAVVLPYRDPLRGSALAAFLVKDADREKREIRQSIRRRLKPIERPGRIVFLHEIPLNDRGKVDQQAIWHRAETEEMSE